MLLRRPHAEASGKLEPEWTGPSVVTKNNQDPFVW
jgi:hypothetical protein